MSKDEATTSPKDAALKLALEALEEACGKRCNSQYNPCYARTVITAIKEALAQPTSADYAMGYTEGFNDACKKPKQEPHNFCPRCGKRLIGMAFAAGGVHTCTPPEGEHQ